MKPIKEQYKEIVSGWNDERTENVANRCTEIAEEFAVDFAQWVQFHSELWIKYRTSELLEIYKKEKGL
jgi:hypothetical protein